MTSAAGTPISNLRGSACLAALGLSPTSGAPSAGCMIAKASAVRLQRLALQSGSRLTLLLWHNGSSPASDEIAMRASCSARTLARWPRGSHALAPDRQLAPHIRLARLSTVVQDTPILPSSPPPPPGQTSRPVAISHQDGSPKHLSPLQAAAAATAPRHNWTRDEIAAIYHQPLMELAYQAVRLPPCSLRFHTSAWF